MRIQSYFLIVLLGISTALCGCSQHPRIQEDIAQEGGTLSLGGASLDIPAGTLAASVLVGLEQNAPGEEVELAENETPVSDVFTITNNQDVVLNDAGEPFRFALPFDTAAVGAASPSDAEVFVKMVTENGVFSIMGTVADGQVEIALCGLPFHASFQAIYNPNRIVVEEEESPKRLTPLPPWETTEWAVYYDPTASEVRRAVATVLNRPEAEVTGDDVVQVLKDRVLKNARDVSLEYEGMGLRQPNLEVRTRNDGQKRLMLHIVTTKTMFEGSASEDGVGQVNIQCPVIARTPDYYLGTVKGVIAHEVFHAIVNGYNLKMGHTSLMQPAYGGYNEGMATVMGHTIDEGGVISVRPNVLPHRSYTMMLNQPLGICEPRTARYTNNDFFAYIAKHYGGGSMAYIAGTGVDDDGDKNGVLEQTRKYLTDVDTELLPWASPAENYLAAYRMCMDVTLSKQFDASLADVYWDFARNRAYENNADSRLRADDTETRWQLCSDHFEAAGICERTFSTDDQTINLSYTSAPALNEIQPFSTRALVFKGGSFNADLVLTFDRSNWLADDLGNSIRAIIYKSGEEGSALGAENTVTLPGFGLDFNQVAVLLCNVSVDGPYSIQMTAQTQPHEDTGPCTPNEPTDRWHIEYNNDCLTPWVTDSDDLWHFKDDGTVSDHWLGVIRDYTWRVEGNKMIVSFGTDKGTMEATFSQDCDRMENGVFVGDFVRFPCWKAGRE